MTMGCLVPFTRIASNVVHLIVDYYGGALANIIWVAGKKQEKK